MRNIGRIIRKIIVLLLAMTFALSAALCEQTAWDCPGCGRTGNTGNYCGGCAHPAPWIEIMNAEKSEAVEKDASAFRKIDNIVTFGHYEQDNDPSNGTEEIEWIVLDYDEKENKALLLSRYGLDAKPYNEENKPVTWEQCTLRAWLNGDFLNSAFSTKDQAAILTTVTQDRVFLLSIGEAKHYLGVTFNDNNNIKSRVAPTAYAIAKGAWIINSHQTSEKKAAGCWWLRSPGFLDMRSAAYVITDGRYSDSFVYYSDNVVRPALWLNLDSDIFATMTAGE